LQSTLNESSNNFPLILNFIQNIQPVHTHEIPLILNFVQNIEPVHTHEKNK